MVVFSQSLQMLEASWRGSDQVWETLDHEIISHRCRWWIQQSGQDETTPNIRQQVPGMMHRESMWGWATLSSKAKWSWRLLHKAHTPHAILENSRVESERLRIEPKESELSFFKKLLDRLTDIENRLVLDKGEGAWGRDGLGVWG